MYRYHPKTAFHVFTQQMYLLNSFRRAAQSSSLLYKIPCIS